MIKTGPYLLVDRKYNRLELGQYGNILGDWKDTFLKLRDSKCVI